MRRAWLLICWVRLVDAVGAAAEVDGRLDGLKQVVFARLYIFCWSAVRMADRPLCHSELGLRWRALVRGEGSTSRTGSMKALLRTAQLQYELCGAVEQHCKLFLRTA